MSSADFTITNKSKTVQFDVHSRRGLKGDTGTTGDSAYQAWLDLGNTGDEAAFVASLKGVQGDQGIQGIQGEKGDKGDTGDTGATGAKGDKGDTGAQGVQGIQGEQGLQGIQGIPGAQGVKGDTGAQGDPGVVQSVNGQSVANVVLDHTDVGADQAGTAAAAQSAAELHADIAVSNLNQSLGSAAFSDDSDFATAAQGALADTAVQIEADPTVPAWAKAPSKPSYTKTEIGLGSVDNTADSAKPVSTAQSAALALKADVSALNSHTLNTSNPHSVTKAQVGLGNVDNTSDASKPVSTATQTALDGKVAKTGLARRLYGTNDAAEQVTFPYADLAADNWSIAGRNGSGQIVTATPTSAGHAVTKAYVDAKVPIYGTGFPNGVVTAPTGSIYIDTAVTNGASSWIKKSGTGNTGWQVLEGDTGWRNISGLLVNGWTALTLHIRRLNNVVYLRAVGMNNSSATTSTFLTLPAGFLTDQRIPFFATNSETGTSSVLWVGQVVYDDTCKFPITPSISVGFAVSPFVANDAYPTTLPGTPV